MGFSVAPPHCAEAERSVLGAMLVDAAAGSKVAGIVNEDMFYHKPNRTLFRAMAAVMDRGHPIDPVTLSEHLKQSGDLEAVGGMLYLARLHSEVPTAANVEFHAQIVRDKWSERKVAEAARALSDQPHDRTLRQKLLTALTDAPSKGAGQSRTLVRSLAEILSDPDAMKEPEPVIPRLAYAGRLTLLSAREKEGKSTLASAGAASVSDGARFLGEMGRPGPVLWVGLEEHPGDTARRFQSFGAQGERVFLLEVLEHPFANLAAAVEQSGAVLVVVDTLSRFAETLVRDASKSTEWTPVMGGLTRVARETGAAVLVLHHARKDGGYRDSTAIGAGVDAIFEMTAGDDGTTRKIKGKGRWPIEDFAVRLDGNEYWLAAGELTLDARVLLFIESSPGCSMRAVTGGVSGRTEAIAAAVTHLLATGAIEDLGGPTGRKLYSRNRETGRAADSGGGVSRENPQGNKAETLSGNGTEPECFPFPSPRAPERETVPATEAEPEGLEL